MKKRIILALIILLAPFTSHVQATTMTEEPFSDETLLKPLLEKTESTQPIPRNRSIEQPIILSQQEVNDIQKIQQDYHSMLNSQTNEPKFLEKPVLQNGTYNLGKFNPNVQNSMVQQVNFYRGLTNLKAITLNQENIDLAQHAAIGMAAIRRQTHYLSNYPKPDDMPTTFWETADKGTRNSNIHSSIHEQSLNSHVDSFIVDYGDINNVVGHRLGILGMDPETIGSGYAQVNDDFPSSVNYYTALNLTSNYRAIPTKYDNDFVSHWPSANYFPIQLYNNDNPYSDDYYKENSFEEYEKNMRWSIHFNQKGYHIADEISVELINQDTGEKTKMENDANGGELTIRNPTPGYYGKGGYASIIFRPNHDFTISANTLYTVNVTGVVKDGEPFDYSYSTRIIDMNATYVAGEIPVKSVSISPDQLTLGRGEHVQLNSTVAPSNAANKEVIWSSSDPSIATVNEAGRVSTIKAGTVTISAKTVDGGHTATATIIVEDRYTPVTSIEVTDKKAYVISQIGKTTTIQAKALPENASNSKLIWESKNSDVATVSQEGVIEAKAAGRVEITVYPEENPALAYTFTVITDDHGESTSESTNLTLGVPVEGTFDYEFNERLPFVPASGDNDYFRFKAPQAGTYIFSGFAQKQNGNAEKIGVAYYTNKKGTWMSQLDMTGFTTFTLDKNETVWFYTFGRKVVMPGSNVALEAAETGSTYTVMMDLKENYQFGSISILDTANKPFPSNPKIKVGETIQLKATIENATITSPFYYNLKWESQQQDIATVNRDTGEITTKKPGKVTVIAKNDYGFYGKSNIEQQITFTVE